MEVNFARLCVILPLSEVGNPPNHITLMAVRFFQHQLEVDIFIVRTFQASFSSPP